MFVLMLYSNLFHYFVTGPFMKPVLFDADTCEDTWWWNLLYLNNFFTDDGYVSQPTCLTSLHTFALSPVKFFKVWTNVLYFQCMGWAWYLTLDWQFFCIAPLFIYVLWKYVETHATREITQKEFNHTNMCFLLLQKQMGWNSSQFLWISWWSDWCSLL